MNIQCLLFCVFVNSDLDKIPYSRNNRCCKGDWILKIIPEILNHRFYSHEKSVQTCGSFSFVVRTHDDARPNSKQFVSSVLYSFLLSPHPDHTLFAIFCKYKHFFSMDPLVEFWFFFSYNLQNSCCDVLLALCYAFIRDDLFCAHIYSNHILTWVLTLAICRYAMPVCRTSHHHTSFIPHAI